MKILADFKKYNANDKLQNRPDCVARAISLAFGQEYRQTLNELHALKRRLGYEKHNILKVFGLYIETIKHATEVKNVDGDITVSQFCDIYFEGVYIVLCGDKPGSYAHLVCIINGDIYDSWDCSNNYVTKIWCVKEGHQDLSDADVSLAFDEIVADADQYVQKLVKTKMPYVTAEFDATLAGPKDPTLATVYLDLQLNQEMIDKLNESAHVNNDGESSCRFIIRFNPNLSQEENIAQAEKKLKYEIREWLWEFRHTIETILKRQKLVTHPSFRGDRSVLVKLPEEIWPYVTWIMYDPKWNWQPYEMFCSPLPDDPNQNSVRFDAKTLVELKNQVNKYIKTFERPEGGTYS